MAIRASQLERLDSIIGGLDSLHEDGRVITIGGTEPQQRLVGGIAKHKLREKMLRLQHLVDTSNTREQELMRVIGRQVKRVTFDRRRFDDSRPDVQPGAEDPLLARHGKIMSTMRALLARNEQQIILDAAREYDLMEPLILAVGALVAAMLPFVTKRAPAAALTKGGRIKTGPEIAAIVERLYNPHISRARRDEGAEKFSYDVDGAGAPGRHGLFALVDFMLGLMPPDIEGKWDGDSAGIAAPVWPDILGASADLEKRRGMLEADAAEHEPRVAAHEECPCLISRRFALGILEIERELEPHITAIENYYIDAATYVTALHEAMEKWMRSARSAESAKSTGPDA